MTILLFESIYNKMIQMLSEKLGKKISETLFYKLKKESKAKEKIKDSDLITSILNDFNNLIDGFDICVVFQNKFSLPLYKDTEFVYHVSVTLDKHRI